MWQMNHTTPCQTPEFSKLFSTLTSVLLLIVGLCLAFRPTLLSCFAQIQADPWDTRLNNYILEHSYQWLTGNALHRDFWSPPLFWPTPNVAAYTDLLLGTAPVYWFSRVVGFLPDTSFQLWMMAVFCLNYGCALLLFRKGWGLSILGSSAGAYLFTFANARLAQIAHQQLLPQFYSLLAIFCLIKCFADPRSERKTKWIFLFAAALVLQLYSGYYLGWFLCFGLTVFGCVSLMNKAVRDLITGFTKHNWLMLLVSAAATGLALGYIASHYLQVQSQLGPRNWDEVFTMVPRLKSWLYCGDNHLSCGWLKHFVNFDTLPMSWEQVLCPGIGTLVLCLYGFGHVKFRANVWGRLFVVSSLLITLLALVYPCDITPWKLIWNYFPGAGAIRAVSRIGLLLLIPISLGVALGIDRLAHRKNLLALLLVLLCMEQLFVSVGYDKLAMRADVAALASRIPSSCTSFYVAHQLGNGMPTSNQPYQKKCLRASPTSGIYVFRSAKYQLDAMWAGLLLNKPTVNGYSGNFPRNWWPLWNAVVDSSASAHLVQNVAAWCVTNELRTDDTCIVWTETDAN